MKKNIRELFDAFMLQQDNLYDFLEKVETDDGYIGKNELNIFFVQMITSEFHGKTFGMPKSDEMKSNDEWEYAVFYPSDIQDAY